LAWTEQELHSVWVRPPQDPAFYMTQPELQLFADPVIQVF
jgi:hypothetical protein